MSGAKRSKRHHYLPQFYLKGFADPQGRLHVYDRRNNQFRAQKPLNIAFVNHWYRVKSKGKKADSVERLLADEIEDRAAPLIKQIGRRDLKLTSDDREILAVFVALMRTRTPTFDREANRAADEWSRWDLKRSLPTLEAVEEDLRRFERETGESMSDVEANDVLKMIREGTYDIQLSRTEKIRLMLEVGLGLVPRLLAMDWDFLFAPQGTAFITSDNPFTVVPPPGHDPGGYDYGVLTPKAVSVLPLSSDVCLSLSKKKGAISGGEIDVGFLNDVNYFVAANSDRFVLATDEPLLRRIVREMENGPQGRTHAHISDDRNL